jgi:hypothetical protein
VDRDHAAQDLGEGGLFGLAHLAHGQGAGDVGGPVLVLRATVDQEQLAGQEGGVRLLRHAVVDDGAMGARARDRVEADVLQRAVSARKPSSARTTSISVSPPLGRGFVEPAQEPGKGRAVAQMRLGRGGDLGGVFARLADQAGVGAGGGLAGPVPSASSSACGAELLSTRIGAGEPGQHGHHRVGVVDRDAGGQGHAGQFLRLHEEVERAGAVQDRHGMKQRRMPHIPAAQVQQPADAVGLGDQGRVLARLRPDRPPRPSASPRR